LSAFEALSNHRDLAIHQKAGVSVNLFTKSPDFWWIGDFHVNRIIGLRASLSKTSPSVESFRDSTTI